MRTFPTLIATGNFRYNLPGIIVYNVSSLQISPGNCSKEFIAILVTLSDSDGNNRGAFSTLSFSFADNSKLILDANL